MSWPSSGTRDGTPGAVADPHRSPGPGRARRERAHVEYYSLLRARYELPILPIVVYLRGGKKGFATEEYRHTLFGAEILSFRYESVSLARLAAEEYLERGGPAGAALAALMNRSSRSRSRSLEALRLSMLWGVLGSTLDDTRQFLLIDLVETYFPLSGRQKQRYERLVSRKENRKVQDVELTWAEKLEKKGREEGLLIGKRETLVRLMSAKYGSLPDATTTRVEAIATTDEARCAARAGAHR